MIDEYMLFKDTSEVFSMLDPDELPEIYNYLASIIGDDELYEDDPFAIASVLVNADKPAPLPGFLIDFITELYETEIKEGNAAAMNDLGSQYYDGSRGFEQSFEKALYLYDMAAKRGSRVAQENLGYCYYYGRNTQVDYKKAFHYFALGAFDGHIISLYKIGDMYLNGYYVEKNEEEAFRIYKRCAETMTPEAEPIAGGQVYLRLGNMFLDGIGTEADAKTALICYQKAEALLYDIVKDQSVMYRKSLEGAIKGQAKARKKLAEELPDGQWPFDQ